MKKLNLKTIKSDFAILDVLAGRKTLAKHFAGLRGFVVCPKDKRVYVKIEGYIDGIYGSDDGVSREFSVAVQSVKITRPRK